MAQRHGLGGPGIVAMAGGLLAIGLVAAGLVAGAGRAPRAVAAPQATDGCRATPQFVAGLSAGPGLALASDGPTMGLTLRAADGSAAYQHPSWDDAGYLGPIAYDAAGNVYAAPTPRLSLVDNPLAGAATLWRADSVSGELRPFVTLPGAASQRNPFGVIGLFYACGLDTLYAGSVLGSTPGEQRGGVVAISLPDGAQTPILSGTDVLGVLLVRQGAGYTLYAGLARSPALIALPLDSRGRPSGPPATMLDLTAAGATPQERARKLRLVGDQLLVDLVPFAYSLQINATDRPPSRRAVWVWDAERGGWSLSRPAS